MLEDLIKCLQPYRDAIKQLQAQQSPTLSTLLPIVYKTIEEIGKHREQVPVFKTAAEAAFADIKQRWQDKFPTEGLLAYMLDPRYRFYSNIFTKESRTPWEDNIRKMIQKMKDKENKYENKYENKEEIKEEIKKEKKVLEKEKEELEKKKRNLEWLGLSHSTQHMNKGDEYKQFMDEGPCDPCEDPLMWWKKNEKRFPYLARLAKKFLAIQASSASPERLFSVAGNLITERRSCLTPDHVKEIMFIKLNAELLPKL